MLGAREYNYEWKYTNKSSVPPPAGRSAARGAPPRGARRCGGAPRRRGVQLVGDNAELWFEKIKAAGLEPDVVSIYHINILRSERRKI